jgi:hypothetical protein
MALLLATDHSFALRGAGNFRAVNADGFCVDLIRPEDKRFMLGAGRQHLAGHVGDLRGAPLHGLTWLLNAPKFEVVAIAEDGYPVRWVTPEPRAFALHKLWVARREDRDPVKRARDEAQAVAVAQLCRSHLGQAFEPGELRAFPAAVRALLGSLTDDAADSDAASIPTPRW